MTFRSDGHLVVQVGAVVTPALNVRIEEFEALHDPLLPRGEEASVRSVHHLGVSAVLSPERVPFLTQLLLWNKNTKISNLKINDVAEIKA